MDMCLPKQCVKSLSYKVHSIEIEIKNPSSLPFPVKRSDVLLKNRARQNTHIEIQTNLLSYSGDTPVERSYAI